MAQIRTNGSCNALMVQRVHVLSSASCTRRCSGALVCRSMLCNGFMSKHSHSKRLPDNNKGGTMQTSLGAQKLM